MPEAAAVRAPGAGCLWLGQEPKLIEIAGLAETGLDLLGADLLRVKCDFNDLESTAGVDITDPRQFEKDTSYLTYVMVRVKCGRFETPGLHEASLAGELSATRNL
jgi:hypothetical protein